MAYLAAITRRLQLVAGILEPATAPDGLGRQAGGRGGCAQWGPTAPGDQHGVEPRRVRGSSRPVDGGGLLAAGSGRGRRLPDHLKLHIGLAWTDLDAP